MHSVERITPGEMYAAALAMIKAGVSVIPIQPGTKEPPVGFRWGEFTRRFADASELFDWFETRQWQVAGVCGGISGNLVVIDFDRADQPDGGYAEHAARFPAIRDLPRARTGRGRVHVYCRSTVPTDKYVVGDAGSRIEVRSGNHYCVAPPSIHPDTGEPYAWSERRPLSMGIPTIDLATIGFEARQRGEQPAGEPGTEGVGLTPTEMERIVEFAGPFWREGQRHNLSLALAGWMAGYSVPEADAEAVIAALAAHDDAVMRRDVKTSVRDTYRKWKQGIAVAGWSMLTDAAAPLISRGAAAQLEWLLKGRQASITFEVVNTEKPAHPFIISITDLLAEPDEPDLWLVDGLLRATSLGLTVGPPKTYKSFLEQELHLCVAAGIPAFGLFHVPEPRVAVYVQEESSRGALRRRFRGLLAGHGLHPSAIADTLFTVTNQGIELDNADSIRRLVEEVMRVYEPSLITFDPLREVHSADENSSKEMRPILKFLKSLRDEFGVSIQLVHHNNKNPLYDNPADSIRGTTSIWGAMDGALFVGTTEQEGVMQVMPRLKEGGQVKPFLYAIKSVDGAIHLTAFEKPEKGSFDPQRIVTWARERGDWWRIEDAVAEFGLTDRTLRPQIKGLVLAERLKEQKVGKHHRLLYAHLEVDDDEPTF